MVNVPAAGVVDAERLRVLAAPVTRIKPWLMSCALSPRLMAAFELAALVTVTPGPKVTAPPVMPMEAALRMIEPAPPTVCVPWKRRCSQPMLPVVIEPPGAKVRPPVTVRMPQLALESESAAPRVTPVNEALPATMNSAPPEAVQLWWSARTPQA